MQVTPYLFFGGRCEEALEFYKTALGAQIEVMMRFGDNPEPPPPGQGPDVPPEKIMHASVIVEGGRFMASDGMCTGGASFAGMGLTLSVEDEAAAGRCFGALAEDGKVMMPLNRTFFSPSFGMLVDRFGVTWLIIVPAEQQ